MKGCFIVQRRLFNSPLIIDTQSSQILPFSIGSLLAHFTFFSLYFSSGWVQFHPMLLCSRLQRSLIQASLLLFGFLSLVMFVILCTVARSLWFALQYAWASSQVFLPLIKWYSYRWHTKMEEWPRTRNKNIVEYWCWRQECRYEIKIRSMRGHTHTLSPFIFISICYDSRSILNCSSDDDPLTHQNEQKHTPPHLFSVRWHWWNQTQWFKAFKSCQKCPFTPWKMYDLSKIIHFFVVWSQKHL